jgi:hypothetical protein
MRRYALTLFLVLLTACITSTECSPPDAYGVQECTETTYSWLKNLTPFLIGGAFVVAAWLIKLFRGGPPE